MHNTDPSALRKVYFTAWQKFLAQQPLTPMETMIVDIIQHHPEYHPLFSVEHIDDFLFEKFQLDHNPFFHLALHVSVREQISTNRPIGIKTHFKRLLKKYPDNIQVEHKIMDCLARILVENFQRPDPHHEQQYLALIAKLK